MIFLSFLSICPILFTHGQVISATYTSSTSPTAPTISVTTQYKTRWLTKTTTTATNSIVATFNSVYDNCPVGQYPAATVAIVNNDYFSTDEYTTIADRNANDNVDCLRTGGSDNAFNWANLRFCAQYAMRSTGVFRRYSISIEMTPSSAVNYNQLSYGGSIYYMGAEITINCSSRTASPTRSPSSSPTLSPTPRTQSTLVSTYTRSSTIGSVFIYSTTRYATRWLTDTSITATFSSLNNRCPSFQTLRATIFVVDNDYLSSSEYTTIQINGGTSVRCLQYGGKDQTFHWANAKSCRVETLGSVYGSTYTLTVKFTPTSSVDIFPATYNGLTYDMGAAIVIHCSGTFVSASNSGIAAPTPSPTFSSYSSSTAATAAAIVWTTIAIIFGSICFVCCIVGLFFYLCCAAASSAKQNTVNTRVAAAPVVMAVSTTTTTTQGQTMGQPVTQPGIQQPYQTTPQYDYNTAGGIPGPQGGNSEYAAVQQQPQYMNQPLYAPAAPGDQMVGQPGVSGQPGPGMNPGYVPYAPAGDAPPQYNAAVMTAPPGYDVATAPPPYGGAPPAYGGGAPSYGQAPPVYGQVPQQGEGEGAPTTGNVARAY